MTCLQRITNIYHILRQSRLWEKSIAIKKKQVAVLGTNKLWSSLLTLQADKICKIYRFDSTFKKLDYDACEC